MGSPWSGAASGALGGAATGATLGSIIPGIGTTLGALGGGLLGGLGGWFTSEPDQVHQATTQTPEQQEFLRQMLSQLQGGGTNENYQAAQGYLSQLLQNDPASYEKFAAPYMQQFQQQTVPRLAERFAGMGGGLGGGALSSSGFAQALGGAGSDLQARLAQLYSGRQMDAANQSMGNYTNLASLGLGQRGFENYYQPGSPGIGGALIGGLAGGVGKASSAALIAKLMEALGGQGGSSTRSGID